MFGMGMPEILLILVVALIVIGPKKLPDLARSLGRAMNEFKRATSEFRDSIELGDDPGEIKKPLAEIGTKKKEPVDIAPEKDEKIQSGETAEPAVKKSEDKEAGGNAD